MSQRGKNPYGYYGVYGSLAYDFRPVGNERAGDYGKTDACISKKHVRRKDTVNVAFAAACTLCAALLVCGLMLRLSLTEISDRSVKLRNEIEELYDEQTRLKIEHSMCFSPEETEEYAVSELGMIKPSAHQIEYIEASDDSFSEGTEAPENGQRDILSIIKEYFPG